MRTHRLKTLPPYWERVQTGEKTFEIRKNDRDYQVGDILELEYFNPDVQIIVGYNYNAPKLIIAKVNYILKFSLDTEYCIMAIEKIN